MTDVDASAERRQPELRWTGMARQSDVDFEQYRVGLTGLLLPDAGVGVRGGRRRPGDAGAGVAELRSFRGSVGGAVVAVPHRHERVLRHVERAAAPRPPDGPVVPEAVDHARSDRCSRRSPGSSRSPTDASSSSSDDPAEQTVARESIRLAFVAALQHLPPRQRAVLILREVLRLKAEEVAELLGSTVASVNSALQRARATLAASDLSDTDAIDPMDDAHRELLDRYVDAFERYDMESLTSLLHEDATLSMPPYELWLRGHADIRGWMLGTGMRVSRLAPRADVGERHAGVRAVPAERSGRQPRAVGAPGHRGLRRSDRRHQLVPRHGEPVPDVRSAGALAG